MRRIRRTEVTVETDEMLIISHRAEFTERCPACGEAVGLVTPEQAAAFTSIPIETICSWVETGVVHHWQTGQGVLLVCLKSLLRSSRSSGLLGSIEEESI